MTTIKCTGDEMASPLIPQETYTAVGHSLPTPQCIEESGATNEKLGLPTTEVASFQPLLDTIKLQEQTRMAQIRQKQNALTPFYRLPTELIIAIFRATLYDKDTTSYYKRLGHISSVSSAWKTLVNISPSLWTVISGKHSPRIIELALERSKDVLLTADNQGINMQSKRRIAKALTQGEVRSRLRSLDLCVCHLSEHRLAFSEGPAPALEKLKLSVSGRWLGYDKAKGLDLFKGEAGRLQEISLNEFAIRWDSPILVGLKSLEIKNLVYGPSSTQMLHILSQAPELARLILRNVAFPEETAFDRQTYPAISLSRLTYLHLQALSPTSMSLILSTIRVPTCRSLRTIANLRTNDVADIPVTDINHLTSAIASIVAMSKHGTVVVDLGSRMFLCRLGPGGSSEDEGFLDMAIPIEDPTQYLRWFVELLEQASHINNIDTEVEIRLGGGPFSIGQEICSLLGCMKVTKISCGRLVDAASLIQYMNASHLPATTQQSPLPHLQHLTMHGRPNEQALLAMLESRSNRMMTKEAPQSKQFLPAPMPSLCFVGHQTINAVTVLQILTTYGPKAVSWEDDWGNKLFVFHLGNEAAPAEVSEGPGH